MPRKYDRVTGELFENAEHLNEVFERVFYTEVRWWKNRFSDCIWRECKFYRTSFAHNSVFSHCAFEQCRFWGQDTNLGGPARFEDCDFRNCRFENVQFW